MAKYKFKLKQLSITEHFSPLQVKIFVFSILGVTALFLITYIPFTAYHNYTVGAENRREAEFRADSSQSIVESPKVHDFQFPGDFLSFNPKLLPNRSLDHQWQRAETHFFWVSPNDMGIANLNAKNHILLSNYLDDFEASNKGF